MDLAETFGMIRYGRRFKRLYRHRDFPNNLADLYLVSYPKAGRTWIRYMISQVALLEMGSEELANSVLEDRFEYAGKKVSPTHAFSQRDEFDATDLAIAAKCFSRSEFVFIHRDPRDVLVSYFYERTKRSLKDTYRTPQMDKFVRDERIGIKRIIDFYNVWRPHLESEKCKLVIAYEEMHSSPDAPLGKLYKLCFGSSPSLPSLRAAVESSTVDRMKEVEVSGKHKKLLQAYDLTDPNSFKVRRGKVGSYREELSPEAAEYCDLLVRRELDPWFGYVRE